LFEKRLQHASSVRGSAVGSAGAPVSAGLKVIPRSHENEAPAMKEREAGLLS
jgi:hypothetical protein